MKMTATPLSRLPLPQAVIFDLDGTLVDTAPDLIAALERIMRRYGLPDMSAAQLRQFIGGGARALIERVPAAANLTLSTQQLDQMQADFLEFYADHLTDHSRPFAAVRETLMMLQENRVLMAVCTNKRQHFADKILHELALDDFFISIIGATETRKPKPDPEPLVHILNELNTDPREAVMVGDSIIDIQAARAADVGMLGVSFGYSPEPIRQLGADICIDHWSEMPAALAQMMRGKNFPA